MDPTRWQRLEDLFHAALERQPSDRHAFLQGGTQDDRTLLTEVEAMLAAHDADGASELEARLIRDAADDALPPHRFEPAPGTRAGPYRLVELIGRGGMGLVYRAERADGQYSQTVAVKLLRSALISTELLDRFVTERQILAGLEHPGIARLLDGGITDDGVPWLAMEQVRGRSITQYCDDERLTIDQRIRVFLRVCDAVQHAHGRLVVHRDLKPSNILVTEDGAVKLLDFGIARLLSPDSSQAAATRTMLPVMTPEYASPEQVRGEAITTATDVYALGLLLYELLSGVRAHSDTATLLTLHQSICEDDLPLPSQRVNDGADEDRVERAARRATRVDRLQRRLRGDLDVICATALRKDPLRRYASVESLAADLERHLGGLPVLARADTLGYRASRFVRRNPVAIAATVLVVASLAIGLTVALSGLVRARDAERVARSEAATANSVSMFLADLFRASDPAESRGDTLTARDLLDRGARRIREQLSDEPIARARLLRAIANAYGSLGLYADALPLMQESRDLMAEGGPAQADAHVTVLGELATLYLRAGDYERARDLAQLAVTERVENGDTASEELRRALNQLGMTNGRLGRLDEARAALERSLVLGERLHGTDHIDNSGTLNNLAIVHWQLGDAARAYTIYERILAVQQRELGDDHPAVAITLNNLALAANRLGRLDDAVAAHERALAIRERILPTDHPDIAESLNNLGVLHTTRGEHDTALGLLERALAIRQRTLAAGHAFTASTLANIATARLAVGDIDGAAPLFERARSDLETALGPDHPEVAFTILGLARVARQRGDVASAEAAYRRVLSTYEQGYPARGDALAEYAVFLAEQGRTAEADSIRLLAAGSQAARDRR